MAPLTVAGKSAFLSSRTERVLSNSAAEFVEVRAGREICRRATGGLLNIVDEQEIVKITDEGNEEALEVTIEAPKFVRETDRFVPKDEAPNLAACYKESIEMRMKFQETLKGFTTLLQSRKIFDKLKIEARDPADYDLEYVLKIASLVQEHKEGVDNTRTVKKFIQKCFRGVNRHKAALAGILAMVPDDMYGSVISGGFSLILAAVESHETLRVEIQSTLADIPRRLDNVKRLSEVNIKSLELHHCADQLFLSIYIVLERIIDKLSMNWVEKGVKKIKGHGDSIKEAIESVGEKVTEFQEQVNICAQLRLGRIEDGVQSIQMQLSDIEKGLSLTEPSYEQITSHIYTSLYKLLTSGPDFELVTDTSTNRFRFVRITQQDTAQIPNLSQGKLEMASPTPSSSSKRDGSIVFSLDEARNLADTWFAALDSFDPSPGKQIDQCLAGFEEFSLKEKDRVQWIMASGEIQNWLTLMESNILDVRPDAAPRSCGLRRMDSLDDDISGPRAVYNSLNGQLLKFMLDKRPSANFSFIEHKKLMRKSKNKSRYAKELFRELVSALPEKDVVVVILDSFSRLGGTSKDEAKGDGIIKDLAVLVNEMPQLVIKVLVTDAMPDCSVKRLAHSTLYVPDDVDGWRNSINLDLLDIENLAMIDQLVKRQEQDSLVSEDWSDSSSDSSSI
ncbi:hypothetical protein B0I35DRAFT_517535 [Stachybotrys elegans]|uniref:Uncharacterized protein n=1 Tax=Stachybotrys elegans TaxID=80388 RepID=A0A8K0SGE0_9HYPO|nr:hypothetical protein B0I35DRAFT_517535 [Stachybotrys elegans]